MTQKYFNQLNYTLGNEDTSIDCEIVSKLGSQNIFNVAGCGSRSFPLMACGAALSMVDISEYQLALCRLREALYKQLTFNEFLLFLEFPPFHGQDNRFERQKIFRSLDLNSRDRDFFRGLFVENDWKSLLYLGKWERTFQTMAHALRLMLGKNYGDIFDFHNLDEQVSYFQNKFPRLKWNTLLFILGNKSVFNALLYKGDFIEKNVEENHFEYYQNSFDQLFNNNLARNSFFAHLCFFGEIKHSDGNPIEAIEENFNAVKANLLEGDMVQYYQGDLVKLLQQEEHANRYDYIGLSDVPSYFKGNVEKDFLQAIKPSLKKEGVVCLRNYLRIPNCDKEGFENITHRFQDLYLKEKVGVYRFQLFQKL